MSGPTGRSRASRVGHEEELQELIRRHGPLAHALAIRIVQHPRRAEEIVQEAFATVWRTPQMSVPEHCSVPAWLMRIVHQRAVDAVRRDRLFRRRPQDEVVAPESGVLHDPTDEPAHVSQRSRERRKAQHVLEALPQDQREVIEWMYLDGLSQSQVAQRSRLPVSTVKSNTLLAMRRLRVHLAALDHEGSSDP